MKRWLALTCLVLFLVCGAAAALPARAEEELAPPRYVTVVDEKGQHLAVTGHVLRPGDELLALDNQRYRIIRVDGRRAVARLVGAEDLSALLTPADQASISRLLEEREGVSAGRSRASGGAVPRLRVWQERLRAALAAAGQPVASPQKVVGIYHTHSDESYEPTQGAASVEGKGGVFAVGASLASRLREKGIMPVHDMSIYLPHDGRAYERSRRGAMSLVSSRPLAILDVHRDSGPAEEYLRDLAGQLTSQIVIVVGRQNPQASANGSFAERVKAVADQTYPGLVKGILYVGGKFNQDVHPRNLLIEVGTEKVTQEQAERGAALLADVIPVAAAALGPAGGREAGGALRALWWVLGLAGLLGGAYLWLSAGSWKEARRRLERWLGEVTLRGGGRYGRK